MITKNSKLETGTLKPEICNSPGMRFYYTLLLIQIVMKEVFYKGKPYQFKVVTQNGRREFHLFENGAVKYTVEENELDIKSIVSLILDAYYRNVKSASTKSTVLS